MTKWQHPDAHYFTVKRPNGKWSVLEKNPDGTKEYLGEYDTQKEALDKENELENQGNALRRGKLIEEQEKALHDFKKGATNRERKKEENFARQEAVDLHNERLAQRKQEFEQYKTRHQQRRNERGP